MSKKLDALEVSKQLKDFVLKFVKNGLDRRFIHGSFDIIETELKRLEGNAETWKEVAEHKKKEFDIIHEECVRLTKIKNKQDEILRIIKDKGLERNEILLIKKHDFADYMAVMTQLYWGDETLSKKLKTQVEFDLLKEYFKDE